MRYAQIIGTGHYVPERVMTNADFDRLLGEPVGDWLEENVGIRERHLMADDQVTSDLATAAGRVALDRAGLQPSDLDRIIVATDTPDYLSPATAAVVQAKLGASRAGAFDINSACAGWVTALDVAAKTIVTEPEERFILVIGAYGMSRFLDWTDKKTVTLFADGAGAVVVGADSRPGWLATVTAAAGEYHDALGIYTGGTYRPATAANVAAYGPPRVQLHRALSVIVPHQLVDLLTVLIVLDELDHWRCSQLGAVMLTAKAEHTQVGEGLPLRELIVVEQLLISFFLDRCLDAVGCAQSLQQPVSLGDIHLAARNMQGGLRFPRQRRTLTGQPHHVVARDGLALVGHAQEVATVGGGCHCQCARNTQLDVLTPIGGGDDIWQHRNVDCAVGQLAPKSVG